MYRKGATFEDLELFLKVMQTRCGNIPVCCDQEESLREIAHGTAGRLGLPTGVTGVEQGQASGRAEQRVRALRERLQIMLRTQDVEMQRSFSIILLPTPREAHTQGTKAPSNVVGFLARVRVRSKINDEKQPRFLVDWALGHKDADIITPMEHGSVRRNGSWKYSLEGRSVANDDEPQNALGKMKNTKPKVQSSWCANMESMSILVENTRLIVDQQFFPLP